MFLGNFELNDKKFQGVDPQTFFQPTTVVAVNVILSIICHRWLLNCVLSADDCIDWFATSTLSQLKFNFRIFRGRLCTNNLHGKLKIISASIIRGSAKREKCLLCRGIRHCARLSSNRYTTCSGTTDSRLCHREFSS